MLLFLLATQLICPALCFWDVGTTTRNPVEGDKTPRQSFFRWEKVFSARWLPYYWFWSMDWETYKRNRKLRSIAGVSIDQIPLSVAIILNRRTLISSANYLEPYMDRQKDLRIWALGRGGQEHTPFRYRVWRVRRLLPKSDNPEHSHGPSGEHVPRHDIVIIHTLDQMYLYNGYTKRHNYAVRAVLTTKHRLVIGDRIWVAGSGYKNLKHIRENYWIQHHTLQRDSIVDCSKYLPKWWGKFICMYNVEGFSGVQSGMALFASTGDDDHLMGIGCFEIRYNEHRVLVFTDVRYYVDWITIYANITPGDYYEYAYPKWSVPYSWYFEGGSNRPYIPKWNIWYDLLPLENNERSQKNRTVEQNTKTTTTPQTSGKKSLLQYYYFLILPL